MGSSDASPSEDEKLREEIATLKSELDSLKSSMPAHSLSPGMLQRLEDIEADIAHREKQLGEQSSENP